MEWLIQCVHHHSAHVPADIQDLLVQVKLTDLSSKHKSYLSHDAPSGNDKKLTNLSSKHKYYLSHDALSGNDKNLQI